MDLIKFNDYTPPSPSTYEVNYSDVNGEESQVEDGTTYIERIRTSVPSIKVGWTNLTNEQATAITNQIENDTVNVSYFYGDIKQSEMTVGARSLKLKLRADSEKSFWDLSFDLKG